MIERTAHSMCSQIAFTAGHTHTSTHWFFDDSKIVDMSKIEFSLELNEVTGINDIACKLEQMEY